MAGCHAKFAFMNRVTKTKLYMKYSSAERRFNVMVKHPPVGGWVLSFQANSNAAIFLMRIDQI